MKLHRNTLILLVVAIALSGIVLVAEALRSVSEGGGVTQKAGDRLFDFKEAQVKALTIDYQGETVAFERDQEDVWQMTTPESALAEPASLTFLLNLLTTEPSNRKISITPDQQADFGFTNPTSTIEITLENGDTHRLVLGAEDFSGGSLYVQVDPAQVPAEPDVEEIEIQVATIDLINGVDRPLEEWKAVLEDPEAADDSSAADADTSSAPEDAPSPASPENSQQSADSSANNSSAAETAAETDSHSEPPEALEAPPPATNPDNSADPASEANQQNPAE